MVADIKEVSKGLVTLAASLRVIERGKQKDAAGQT
jgi:hypothetical protein